jgi:uncharacterized protein
MKPNVDFEGARQYVLSRLEAQLPATLLYHGVHHTRDDVLPAAERLGARAGLDPEALLTLRTAALYHDTGYLVTYFRNEDEGAQIARETLPGFGYSPEQIESVGALIMATQLPQEPEDDLQALICDADLDSLGREDFLKSSLLLRTELATHGVETTLREWYERQIAFLTTHSYFSHEAQALRDVGKARNLARLRELLAEMA